MLVWVSNEGFASNGGSINGCHFTEAVHIKAHSDRVDQFEFQIGVCGVLHDAFHCSCVISSKGMGNVGRVGLQLCLQSGKVVAGGCE